MIGAEHRRVLCKDQSMTLDIHAFLTQHRIHEVECVIPDMTGIARGKTATSEQLAALLGLSAAHLHRFLRGLCSSASARSCLTVRSRSRREAIRCARARPRGLPRKVQIVVGQYWWPWANLASNLKTGQPAFEQTFGMRVVDWRAAHAEQGALFNSYLAKETLAPGGAHRLCARMCRGHKKTIADIGGGYGGLLAALLGAHPEIERCCSTGRPPLKPPSPS